MEPRPPLVRSLINALWQQPLWAVPFALFFGVLNNVGPAGYVKLYEASLVFAFAIRLALIAVELGLMPRLRPTLERGVAQRGLGSWVIGLFYSAAAMVAAYVAGAIIHVWIIPGFLGSPRAWLETGMFALLFTTLFAGFSYAIAFHRVAVERARAVEQVRAELAQAELRALRAQINPHFLFNTLNTIAALIAENPRAAEDTTTRLADVFRYALQASDREHQRLGDELGFLRAYLDIERTRFGERLRIVETIEPGLESFLVPSLLLQPLAENAVRHGVATRPEGGTIQLDARRAGDALVIEVRDDGPGFGSERALSGTGFGLHSVRERLRAAGLGDALQIESRPGYGTRVRVTLPLLQAPPTPHEPRGTEPWTPPAETC